MVDWIIVVGYVLVDRWIVVDDVDFIKVIVMDWCYDLSVDVVLSIGGMGIIGRDLMVDVFEFLYIKVIFGFGELF